MVIAVVTSLLLAAVLTVSALTYRRCFYSPPHKHNKPYERLEGEQYGPVEENLFRIISIMERYSFEEISVTAFDGTPLKGRYYHFVDGAPLLILCHGYRSSCLRDCCGGHALARKMGFNALVIDQRCHGSSGGKTITFGIRERHDVHTWLRWAAERFGRDHPVMLFGLSMGAATVLMGNELGYPGNVVCVMADSPYSAPADIILKVCKDEGFPPRLSYPFIWLGALLFGGFRLDSCTAKDAVRHAKAPVLLIHGEDDRLVPCEMSTEIAAACASPVTVATYPGCGHGLCYMLRPREYERTVFDFLNKIPAVRGWITEDFKNSLK